MMQISKEKEFNKEKSVEMFLNLMNKLGLEISDKSGGSLDTEQDVSSVKRSKNMMDLELNTHSGSAIKIENGRCFLEAIKRSEEQLNVKLFS